MGPRQFLYCLALEIFAVVWAGAVFALISNRLLAGGMAGLYFIGSAFLMLSWIWRSPGRWQVWMLYPLLVHLFGVSLPMVITRFLNADQPFQNVRIWGLSGPEFHVLSGSVFVALIVATLIDLIRAGLRTRRNPN